MEQKFSNDFCRLDYWLISNTLHDLVKTTDIISSIKTDHAAISLALVITGFVDFFRPKVQGLFKDFPRPYFEISRTFL